MQQDIVRKDRTHPHITRETTTWGDAIRPFKVWLSFTSVEIVVWDECWDIADQGCTRAYAAWWEAHRLFQLTILGILEANEIAPSIDEIVGGEGEVEREGREIGGAWVRQRVSSRGGRRQGQVPIEVQVQDVVEQAGPSL